ncbi:metal-dependent hydrolase [Sphingobium limneticum]|uniref:Metal-dependent hydrolase n=1 Tax=Sphingobium limneticum TaxID=1007511 RepID=A0A5J5I1D3_9SPHN|nr:metal-dependent hydrolase [Sphingobium limneticum]KAA9016746.1 metal-dependent hydrolase [Sphingobium limneticum]KAA9029725.1 metal-dependent hydrolase [Sphingobium limneticum]
MTPTDLTITPRDRRFGRDRTVARHWLNGDPIATAFFNALSITFPRGEAYFIDSVRTFRDGVPDRLAGEIAAFIKQEVVHSREHLAFNRQVTDHGYDVSRLDADVTMVLDLAKQRPPIASLAATMALEHFTAILAHELLSDPRHLDGADPEIAALWRWHAIEEIEHKGVAHDTWVHATRDWSRFKRWWVKSAMMLVVTKHFLHHRARGMMDLLRQDGIIGHRAWGGLLNYALVRPGILRRVARPWFGYFLPGFHPWAVDDRALIALAESPYADALQQGALPSPA